MAHHNIDLLEKQIKEYQPLVAGLVDESAFKELQGRYTGPTKLVGGKEALIAAATIQEATMVVTAIVGAAGIEPTVEAIKKGKTIGLANKETLVAGGPLITSLAKEYGVQILPIDSEHSAIFQCLEGQDRKNVDSLIVTASGGPLRTWDSDKIQTATAADCLRHPTWNMGNKITIDSASLFNKGLEVIEAHWLFGFDFDHIDVVVHALTYPKREVLSMNHLDFTKSLQLEFLPPRYDDFPALRLAYEVGRASGFKPAVFNAANETAVYAFLEDKIAFGDIYKVVTSVLESMGPEDDFTLDNLLSIDRWAREKATSLML